LNVTSVSLLQRLRQPHDKAAWARFVKLYTPLLFYWARRAGLQEQDAADLVQDLFLTLVEKLPGFTYDRHKSFRGWLRTVLLNKWRNRRRQVVPQSLDAAAHSPEAALDPGNMEVLEEAEYRRKLVARALELIQRDFQPTTWKAFWECQVEGRPGADVAAKLGISVGAVYVARSRVLNRLREELAGLLD
jgi:RNA polymerase sigma-70 factor (ECF subfamily)